jgi:flagellar protein FliL
MAQNDDLNLAAAADAEKPKGGGLKRIIIIALAVLVAGAAGAGALVFMMDGDAPVSDQAAGELTTPLIYRPLEPALLGNIEGPGRIRFVQVGVVLAIRDPKVVEAVDRHGPVIRNDLIMLLSDKTYEQLNTAEGKETTRLEMLETIRNVLERNTGDPGIESIYFTSFVMQ